MEQKSRSSFSSRIGFVLAAAGSAVGLGNLWRFPYLAAQYGGGIFLLVYLVLVVTFGFTLMITEIAIGRKTRLSCIGAYRALDKRFGFLGWIAAFVPVIIIPYYCVIGGWVAKYLFTFLTGNGAAAADNGPFFNNFTGYNTGSIVSTMLDFSGPTPTAGWSSSKHCKAGADVMSAAAFRVLLLFPALCRTGQKRATHAGSPLCPADAGRPHFPHTRVMALLRFSILATSGLPPYSPSRVQGRASAAVTFSLLVWKASTWRLSS